MKALGRVRTRGEKSVTIKDLVTEIYGESLNEDTRTLALEPFINEVLRKLADDCKVAFELRGGKKKWYSLEEGADNHAAVYSHESFTGVNYSSLRVSGKYL